LSRFASDKYHISAIFLWYHPNMPAKSPLSTVNKIRQVWGLYVPLPELQSFQGVRRMLLKEKDQKVRIQNYLDEGAPPPLPTFMEAVDLGNPFVFTTASIDAIFESGIYQAKSVEGQKIARGIRQALASLTGETTPPVTGLADFLRPIETLIHPETGDLNDEVEAPQELSERIEAAFRESAEEPVFLYNVWRRYRGIWMYKGYLYTSTGHFSEADHKLLILEAFDRERRALEKLRAKFHPRAGESSRSRPRISEAVRIEVWNRDGGKCVRCGSRVNLEYDHIIPVSKGGGNTARNIELLCEKCNRAKGDEIR
jgi:hypothetical protein